MAEACARATLERLRGNAGEFLGDEGLHPNFYQRAMILDSRAESLLDRIDSEVAQERMELFIDVVGETAEQQRAEVLSPALRWWPPKWRFRPSR